MHFGKLLLLLLRLVLCGVFIYAGIAKLAIAPQFAADIQHYKILPWPDAAIVLAIYLPWLEILSGLAVVCRRFTLGGLASIGFLTLVFIAALTSAWLRGLDIYCGCFGKDDFSIHTDYLPLLLRDLTLFACAAFLFVVEFREKSRELS